MSLQNGAQVTNAVFCFVLFLFLLTMFFYNVCHFFLRMQLRDNKQTLCIIIACNILLALIMIVYSERSTNLKISTRHVKDFLTNPKVRLNVTISGHFDAFPMIKPEYGNWFCF